MDKGSRSKKEAREANHKEQKMEEQVLKSLDEGASGLEEKFQLLLRKHVENEYARKKMEQELKAHEKHLESVLREKENLQRDHNKNLLMRDKLQELCREQQKMIKSVKNESMSKIREEEERRKENSAKFQESLNEITIALNKNSDENNKLRDHNLKITKKLKLLTEQYSTRDAQLEKLNEQVKLESQLHLAKLNKVQLESAMEKEILTKEKKIAIEKLLHSQTMLKELTERELQLKEQLNIYTAKYDEFQSSLQKSNDIFVTYKEELEKMSKNTKKLEKDALQWRSKWERSNATLIELATEKKDRDEHAIRCNKQVEQLQKLLRALQHERTQIYKLLRSHNIEVPAMPPLPPEPEKMPSLPVHTEKDKMDKMTKSCAELKQTLANLQCQMHLFSKNDEKATNGKISAVEEQLPMATKAAKDPNIAKKKQAARNKKLKAKGRANKAGTPPVEGVAAENGSNAPPPTETEGETEVEVEDEIFNSGEMVPAEPIQQEAIGKIATTINTPPLSPVSAELQDAAAAVVADEAVPNAEVTSNV